MYENTYVPYSDIEIVTLVITIRSSTYAVSYYIDMTMRNPYKLVTVQFCDSCFIR